MNRNVVLGIALIWAAVVLGTAVVLKGSGYFPQMIPILAAGSAGSLMVVSKCILEYYQCTYEHQGYGEYLNQNSGFIDFFPEYTWAEEAEENR